MVKRWYADFKRGCTDTNDAERSGRPNSAVVSENTKKLHKLVLADCKLKLREIAEELKITEGSVFTILHEHSSMRKLCTKLVSHLLKVSQQQQRLDDLECCLQLFQHNKKEFLSKYVTMNETWIHHFTQESNQQSAEWTASSESCPKRPKMQTSAGKFLASVFWDAQGILITDYLEKGRRINSEYYIALLVCMKEEIAKKRPPKKKKCSFTKTMHCVNCNDGKTTWIALRIASTPTLFYRSVPWWLLAICRSQKNAPGKEIWLQWRSDIRNWGVFWGQRQILLQKRHWIVREVLESVHRPKKRLLMNKVEFWQIEVLLVRPRTYWVMCYFQ